MLRRAPTALTITPTDIADFESYYTRRIAHLHFLKTAEDPNGWFQHPQAYDPDFVVKQIQFEQQRRMMEVQMGQAGGENRGGGGGSGAATDPSDELKPLPGDKARIVRGREERIVGVGGQRG